MKEVPTSLAEEVIINKFFPDSKNLSQVYNAGLEYAFVSSAGEQCHPFVYCKDYLQDGVWVTINGGHICVYGFEYEKGENPPIDLKKLRMAVRLNKSTDLGKQLENSLKLLNEIEDDMGFKKSTRSSAGNFMGTGNEVWVFYGDENWMYAPPLLSFYAIAIRAGLNYTGGGWKNHLEKGEFSTVAKEKDKNYCQRGKKFWQLLAEMKKEEMFAPKQEENYPESLSTLALHNNTGIVAFAQGTIPPALQNKWTL